MKHTHLISGLLAAAVVSSAFIAAAPLTIDSYAFDPFAGRTVAGYETFQRAETLSDGLSLTRISGWKEDGTILSGYTIDWNTSDAAVEPRLTFGEGIYGRDTLTQLASYERSAGSGVPLAGVNGDFFSMQTGVPLGLAVTGGRLVTSGPDGGSALAVDINGRAFVASPRVAISISSGGMTQKIDNLNKYPTIYGSYLITSDFSTSTRSTEPSREVVIQTGLSGQKGFALGSYVTGTVLYVNESVSDTPVTPGTAVISVADVSDAAGGLVSQLKAGDEVTITVASEGLGDFPLMLAMGGGDRILQSGIYYPELADEDHETERRARTAAGVRADGSVVFFAADKGGASDGLTLAELADVMLSLGCADAINLDGGGSTTVAAQSGGGFTVINSPGEGAERAISEGLIFCRAFGAPSADRIAVTAEYPVVLSGGGYDSFTAYAVSGDIWQPIPSSDASWSLNRNFGVIDISPNGKAVMTAASNSGHATVEASWGGMTGSADILVTDSLTSLYLDADSHSVALDGWINLSPRAYFNGMPAGMRVTQLTFDKNYTPESNPLWRPFDVDRTRGEAREAFLYWSRFGYVVRTTDFSARYKPYNNYTYYGIDSDTVNVSAGGARSSADIELGIGAVTLGASSGTIKLAPGVKRLEIDVSFDSVYELDGLTAALKDADGADTALYWEKDAVLSRAGRAKLHIDVPSNVSQPITVVKPVSKDMPWSGFTAVYLESAASSAAGSYFSDVSSNWAEEYIETAHMMGIADGYKKADGTPYYNPGGLLTRAEFAKLLSSYLGLEDDKTIALADVSGWAEPYIRSAIAAGYMRGRDKTDKGYVFAPNDRITRAEVMQVFGYLLPETDRTELNFSDVDKTFPAWALTNSIRCVSSGVIGGYPDGTLRPNNYVTRAEIAAMFVKLDGVM